MFLGAAPKRSEDSSFAFALLIGSGSFAYAEVRRLCDVSYDGGRRWARVEVTFLMGAELNAVIRGGGYRPNTPYALIWFSKEEVAILEQVGLALAGPYEFSASDFRTLFGIPIDADSSQVNTRPVRRWKIRGRDAISGAFIDPRATR